jgi:hypothetical protein
MKSGDFLIFLKKPWPSKKPQKNSILPFFEEKTLT